nr:MAG TPA: hypothetical protein [Caudoviricetes sp.]
MSSSFSSCYSSGFVNHDNTINVLYSLLPTRKQ